LEPRERRRSSLFFTLAWNAVVVVLGLFVFEVVPFKGEVTESFPGVGKLIVGLFGLPGLSMLYHLIWTRLGREEWRVSRNNLEVRQTLLGLPRRRKHTDTEVTLRRYYQNTWALEVGSKPQRLILRQIDPTRLPALFDLGELLARETGWTLRALERPTGANPQATPLTPAPSVSTPTRTLPATVAPLAVDPEQRRKVEPDLEPGERVLWTGRPDAQRVARRALPILLLGVTWALIALFSWQPWSHPLRLVPAVFVWLGARICCTPFTLYRTALQTSYVITDRRVLILTEGKRRKLELYGAVDLCETDRQEQADGSGDLLFARRQEKDSDGVPRTVDVKFVGIPQVRAVEHLLRQLFTDQSSQLP
jgi:hypothetical protein